MNRNTHETGRNKENFLALARRVKRKKTHTLTYKRTYVRSNEKKRVKVLPAGPKYVHLPN